MIAAEMILNRIFLMPGEYVFVNEKTWISTTLGSCVAMTLWHPRLRMGGMCHYMLAKRPIDMRGTPDGRYADEAMQLLVSEASRHADPREFKVKIFGGGRMYDLLSRGRHEDIGALNIRMARELVRQYGFTVAAEDVGGIKPRHITFDVNEGDVWVRHIPNRSIRKSGA